MDHSYALAMALADQQAGVLSARQLLALGFSRGRIGGLVRRGQWQGLLAGVYLVDAGLNQWPWPELPPATRLAAARLAHGPRAPAVLATAARLHDLNPVLPDRGLVHLCLPPGHERHQQPGVRLHTWRLAPEECGRTPDGIPATTLARTLCDLVLASSRWVGVAVLDAALESERIEPDTLPDLEASVAGRRFAARTSPVWSLARVGAQSPLETRVRLVAVDGGLPPDALQYPVRGRDGVLLGYGDIAWRRPGRRVLVAEADGAGPHSTPEALYRDRRRANDFVTWGGVDVVRFTWRDTERPAYVLSVLRAALAR